MFPLQHSDKSVDILMSCVYESNMSLETRAQEFLVSKTRPHVIRVDLQLHSPLVKFGVLLCIHFCNNDAGNAVIYYFNRIKH